jgi:hypothetical protein
MRRRQERIVNIAPNDLLHGVTPPRRASARAVQHEILRLAEPSR